MDTKTTQVDLSHSRMNTYSWSATMMMRFPWHLHSVSVEIANALVHRFIRSNALNCIESRKKKLLLFPHNSLPSKATFPKTHTSLEHYPLSQTAAQEERSEEERNLSRKSSSRTRHRVDPIPWHPSLLTVCQGKRSRLCLFRSHHSRLGSLQAVLSHIVRSYRIPE